MQPIYWAQKKVPSAERRTQAANSRYTEVGRRAQGVGNYKSHIEKANRRLVERTRRQTTTTQETKLRKTETWQATQEVSTENIYLFIYLR